MLKIAPLVIGLPDGELALDGECVVELPTSAVSPCSPEREAAFLSSRELERDLPCTTFAEASIVADEPI